ncbi:hypothetical protein, partial [Escherichia coli]|uniref:hypothetical protein n=1 Tax=Escherichia coli TaxID=562 RepID=UPI001BE3D542
GERSDLGFGDGRAVERYARPLWRRWRVLQPLSPLEARGHPGNDSNGSGPGSPAAGRFGYGGTSMSDEVEQAERLAGIERLALE